MAIDNILVAVEIRKYETTMKRVEVVIPLTSELHAGKLIEACQRSVAHCVDELEKDLQPKK